VQVVDLDLEVKTEHEPREAYIAFLKAALRDFRPHVVGITSMYNNSLQAERLARIVKEEDASIATVAGGSHFGAIGVEALQRISELDFAIQGEGEVAFGDLLSAIEGGSPFTHIPRICYRLDGQVCKNPVGGLLDLAELPPMWVGLSGAIDITRYRRTIPDNSPRKAIYLEAGRGCPFACTFCATAPFWERKYRTKPVYRIVDEIAYLYDSCGYDSFMLVHDLLTVGKKFINEFSEAMQEAHLPVEWMVNHRTDVDLFGLLPKMKAAGCWKMFFGVETASPRQQRAIHKNLQIDQAISTVRSLVDLGLSATCSFVIGYPDETQEELSETIGLGAYLKILGTETIQFHRLRTWPPAPLSKLNLPADFDRESLQIEYPFVSVPAIEMDEIQGDRAFFAGYFAPRSTVGSFFELAQVELFFSQAIALAPLSVAAASHFLGDQLIATFYQALTQSTSLSRSDLDFVGLDLLHNWTAIERLMVTWVCNAAELLQWQRTIIKALLRYEELRLRYVGTDGADIRGMVAHREHWAAMTLDIDLNVTLESLLARSDVNPTCIATTTVILARRNRGSFEAYISGADLMDRLMANDPAVVRFFREIESGTVPV
jgi:radical SAM superfamily enzyme YgiQ (UPF0313 family)